MNFCAAALLVLACGTCMAQQHPSAGTMPPHSRSYPEPEAKAAWRALAAGYVRKAIRDQALNSDPALNVRVDRVMAAVATAVTAIDPRFVDASWRALLIEGFGRGAAAFSGGTILVDAKFVRTHRLDDDELALVLSHEAAHVVAGHLSAKLAFMAELLGKDRLPTARKALLEFLSTDSYAAAFEATARLQEREADRIGAAIFMHTGYDPQGALGLFDKLAALERADGEHRIGPHDTASERKQAISSVMAGMRR